MHELAVTREILDVCIKRAEGARVRSISVAIGALSCLSPDALRFSFDACKPGTAASDAELRIERVPGQEMTIREMEII